MPLSNNPNPMEPDSSLSEELTSAMGMGENPESTDLEATSAPQGGDLPHARMDADLIGSILDIYRIYSVLGQGGMGRVYLARNERLHRQCAIKVIDPEFARLDPRRLEMFTSEARAAAVLNHPHIVAVHSLGEDRGYTFIEMEYVSGGSLGRLLLQENRVSPLRATRFIAQLVSALAAAHEREMIHRDVKPDNVMIANKDWAKLSDFGLARIRDQGDAGENLAGTPFYMAPELFRGCPATCASDVYSTGVTYYKLLTGDVPFPAKSLKEMWRMHASLPTPAPGALVPEMPRDIDNIVLAMLAKEPGERPRCDDELVANLYAIATSLVDLQQLVARAMQGAPVRCEAQGEKFSFDVTLDGNRHQLVNAEVIDGEGGAGRLVSFWTPCAPALPEHYTYVLDLNGRLPFGAVSIREYRGQPYFVMASNHSRGTITAADIRATVLNLGAYADNIEHQLTGADIH